MSMLLAEFSDSCYRDIDLGKPIPGRVIHNAAGRKIENALEFFDCHVSGAAEDTVYGKLGNRGVIVSDRVELALNNPHLRTAAASGDIVAREGGGDTGHPIGILQIYVSSVIIAQNGDSVIALGRQVLGSPLGHPICKRVYIIKRLK